MSVGIGVLFSFDASEAPWPNGIVLTAGTPATFGGGFSPSDHKIFRYEDEKVFGVCVGRIETSHDLLAAIQSEIQQLETKNHHTLSRALNQAAQNCRIESFQRDVLPAYAFPGSQIPQQQQPGRCLAEGRYRCSSDCWGL